MEVRDARAPISSFNKEIDSIIKEHQKTKIVLFNKFDLCDQEKTGKIVTELRQIGIPSLCIGSLIRNYSF